MFSLRAVASLHSYGVPGEAAPALARSLRQAPALRQAEVLHARGQLAAQVVHIVGPVDLRVPKVFCVRAHCARRAMSNSTSRTVLVRLHFE